MRNRLGVACSLLALFAAVGGTGCFDFGGLGSSDDGDDTNGASDSGAPDGSSQNDAASSGDAATATAPPAHAAAGVRFVDVDPRPGNVGGVVVISRAADESDVASYVVYLADASGNRVGTAIGEVPANGRASLRRHANERRDDAHLHAVARFRVAPSREGAVSTLAKAELAQAKNR